VSSDLIPEAVGVIVVPGSGPTPCDLMCIAEGPGETEARLGRPLCDPSGQALSWYLNRAGLSISQFYLDNVCREYTLGNPDPTPEQLAYWTPVLRATIDQVRPRVILALGRFATRWFLGPTVDMDSCHGIPHEGGEFVDDPVERADYASRAGGAVVLPGFHPALGMYQLDARTLIDQDITRAAEVIRLVQGNRRDLVPFRRDPYAGREVYRDCTGPDLRDVINRYRRMGIVHCGYDTEGTPEQPFSLQWSPEPGTGYMLRVGAPGFEVGIAAMQEFIDSGVTIAVHDAGTPRGTGYDTQTSRTMGLMLGHGRLSNTMYSAFALRTEPKGLKPLLWRWCGMRQHDYWGMVEAIGREKQIRYLERVAARGYDDAIKRLLLMQLQYPEITTLHPALARTIEQFRGWPRIPTRLIKENDGTIKPKKFAKLEARAKAILTDITSGKLDKDEKPTDPFKRWGQVEIELRELAVRELGEMPLGTMWDVPLEDAITYSCRDADGTSRLDHALSAQCRLMGVDGCCWTGNEVLPILEEMQHEGMPASRRAFVDLAAQMQVEMDQIQSHIRHTHWGGKPFNPAPNTKDVAEMVVRLGITGLKKTPTGKSSTSMKSLEYLGGKYPAIKDVGEWRRRYKVLGTYCRPLIEIADEQLGARIETRALDGQSEMHLVGIVPNADEGDIFYASGNIKPVTVETRRLAMEDPSLLNQPVRTEIGRKVRACYMTTHDDDPDDPETEVFVGMDYSAQEVRITAHVTGDRLLREIVTDPSRKIHMETASRVFGKPIADIDEISEKIPAKTAFFGMLYGMQGPGLLDLFRSFGLENWPLEECERLIGEIFKIYPALKVTIDRVAQETRRTGMVRDLYGWIRYLPGIWSGRRGEAAEAARQAFSHIIQATAQGQIQNAMATMRKPVREMQMSGLHLKWCLQVHDECIVRTKRWLAGAVMAMMEHAMVGGYGGPRGLKLSVPVTVDGHCSTQWAKLK
jgi:uracil-DNA glycosylase family 4